MDYLQNLNVFRRLLCEHYFIRRLLKGTFVDTISHIFVMDKTLCESYVDERKENNKITGLLEQRITPLRITMHVE